MTEREINEKAREIYTRCFDDVGEYVGVINALVIAVRETSREYDGYLAGAEPREKQIREKDKKIAGLEKENNLLEEWRSKRVEEYCKPCIFAIKVDLDKLDKLEKENAELKKQLGMSNKVYNDNLDYSHHIEEQLTKAKEIIRQLLLLPYANNEEVYADVTSTLNKAEQFLSEVEK